jgi:cell shape-determining protein MreC
MRFTQSILPLTMVVTLVLCMIPTGFGPTNFFAEVVTMVFTPFTFVGGTFAQWLRPPPDGLRGSPGDRDFLLHVQRERDEFERLYLAEQIKSDALQQQLEQLQAFPDEQLRKPVREISARVALRSSAPYGTVTINRGSSHGVIKDTVAAYNRTHLLGRIIEVSALQSVLLPLANPSMGLVDAVVIPQDHSGDVALEKAARIQVEPVGDGTLHGDADRSVLVKVGDLVRVFDAAWPDSAQGMVIGKVLEVGPRDDQPLRNRVIVRPEYHVSGVAYFTLKIELDEAGADRPYGAPATTAPAGTGGRAGAPR